MFRTTIFEPTESPYFPSFLSAASRNWGATWSFVMRNPLSYCIFLASPAAFFPNQAKLVCSVLRSGAPPFLGDGGVHVLKGHGGEGDEFIRMPPDDACDLVVERAAKLSAEFGLRPVHHRRAQGENLHVHRGGGHLLQADVQVEKIGKKGEKLTPGHDELALPPGARAPDLDGVLIALLFNQIQEALRIEVRMRVDSHLALNDR